MYLLKVTADRRGNNLVTRSREIIEEIPDDPHYWDPLCELILDRLERDGVLAPRRTAETA